MGILSLAGKKTRDYSALSRKNKPLRGTGYFVPGYRARAIDTGTGEMRIFCYSRRSMSRQPEHFSAPVPEANIKAILEWLAVLSVLGWALSVALSLSGLRSGANAQRA